MPDTSLSKVIVSAMLSDGRVLHGPIQGNGGYLGTGALWISGAVAMDAAARDLRIAAHRVSGGLPIRHMFEPEPGCVAMYPDDCPEGRGEVVVIPVAGTRFEVTGVR